MLHIGAACAIPQNAVRSCISVHGECRGPHLAMPASLDRQTPFRPQRIGRWSSVLLLLVWSGVAHSLCAPGIAVCTEFTMSSNDAFSVLPLSAVIGNQGLSAQLTRLNETPPGPAAGWQAGTQTRLDDSTCVAFNCPGECTTEAGCSPTSNPLGGPYLGGCAGGISGVREVTHDNCGSAWFRFTFNLPTGFQNARLIGTATVDDEAVVFLNGTPISGLLSNPGCDPNPANGVFDACFNQQDVYSSATLGEDPVSSPGIGQPLRRILSFGGSSQQDPFDSAGLPASFRDGENDVVFALAGDAAYYAPSGLDFQAAVAYTRCGNGVTESGEGCDDGNTNDSDACRNNCTLASCGDGTCVLPEDCGTCAQDCGDCCGNGIIDGREVCDGTNLNYETCVTLGYGGGTLGCSSCLAFDTSGCIVGPPEARLLVRPPTCEVSTDKAEYLASESPIIRVTLTNYNTVPIAVTAYSHALTYKITPTKKRPKGKVRRQRLSANLSSPSRQDILILPAGGLGTAVLGGEFDGRNFAFANATARKATELILTPGQYRISATYKYAGDATADFRLYLGKVKCTAATFTLRP